MVTILILLNIEQYKLFSREANMILSDLERVSKKAASKGSLERFSHYKQLRSSKTKQ